MTPTPTSLPPQTLDRRYQHHPVPTQPQQYVVHHVHHAPAKDTAVAYLLLLLLPPFGAHRFYLGRTGSAITQLLLWLLGVPLSFFVIGVPMLFAAAIWWFVDLFLTAGMVREENQRALTRTGGTGFYRG
ncbi:TM2 domain-containing protein [Agrococcus baldri]|uniref:TM2 domain-containing protein n=1 Tax=Agrococcus baldri TaxID=153730 RepID=A0AA87RH71_9MICO|nr:TM2 domain-containing protein [Agrococcus baldri]GEK80260.1 hypothetical protein ABA31_16110 [Agrococcus baldri]